jgi:hypothetical protein
MVQRRLNTKRLTLSSFWVPRNLSYHIDKQAGTDVTMFVKSREMTGRTKTLPWWLEGEGTENKIHWPHWVWWIDATLLKNLFVFLSIEMYSLYHINHNRWGPLPYLHCCCSEEGSSCRESNPGLPYSKPTLYYLNSVQAPFSFSSDL